MFLSQRWYSLVCFFCFKQKTAYEMRISDWSSDVCSSDLASLDAALARGTNFEDFFAQAPALNPARSAVTGVVCGVRVETIDDPLMREIRILDKMIDELAKGRAMEKILRS